MTRSGALSHCPDLLHSLDYKTWCCLGRLALWCPIVSIGAVEPISRRGVGALSYSDWFTGLSPTYITLVPFVKHVDNIVRPWRSFHQLSSSTFLICYPLHTVSGIIFTSVLPYDNVPVSQVVMTCEDNHNSRHSVPRLCPTCTLLQEMVRNSVSCGTKVTCLKDVALWHDRCCHHF